MRDHKTRVVLTVLLLAAALLLAAPAEAFKGTAVVFFYWSTGGDANPNLWYNFQSLHRVTFTQFTGAEAILPVSLTGQLEKNLSQHSSCLAIGFVNNVQLSCWVPSAASSYTASCPFAEGQWRAVTRGVVYTTPTGQFLPQVSDTVFANCPPPHEPPCSVFNFSTSTRVLDLDSGLPLPHELVADLAPVEMGRVGEDKHGSFQPEEWAVVQVADDGRFEVERASAGRYADALSAEPWQLLDAVGTAALRAAAPLATRDVGGEAEAGGGRYLVIQGAGHRFRLPEPLIKHKTGAMEGLDLGDRSGRVLVRAQFGHHGELQEVATLEGDEVVGQSLAETLELAFVDGAEHRVSVFALFQVDRGEPRLVSAVPTLPRCCCGGFHCV